MFVFLVSLLILVTAAVMFALFRLLFGAPDGRADRSWLEEFSIDKYRPMLRLLSERDYEFLALQSGFTPDIARKLRTQRRKIFRAYLRNLIRDFKRLIGAGQEIVALATDDRSELQMELFRYQISFYMAVSTVYLRLTLYSLGIGTVDVRGLIQSLEVLRSTISLNAATAEHFA